MQTLHSRRGSVMLEFSLVGVPIVFIIISLVWMCVGMWEYQSMESAVSYAVRSSATHGSDCVSQTCSTTVGQVATMLQQMIGVPDNQVNVTLTNADATTISCNPLNTCYTNSSAWPSLAANSPGNAIGITAQYTMNLPIALWTPRNGSEHFSGVTLAAQGKQPVVY